MRTFDWFPKKDPRSLNFLFTAVSGCGSVAERTNIMRTKTVFLDQGQEGACTGFGEENVMALTPYPQVTNNDEAHRIYQRAKFLDEYPGEDYEGSSVNGAMLAAREAGRVKEWFWANGINGVRHGLSYHGAGEMGSYWWDGMWDTDDNGFVHPTGTKVGGHAYALAGYRISLKEPGKKDYRIENSWGPSWGDKGGAWIFEDDLLALLNDDGEIAFPTKVRA